MSEKAKKLTPLKSLGSDDSTLVCGPNGCSIADHQKLMAAQKKQAQTHQQG